MQWKGNVMHKDEVSSQRDARASSLLPENVKQHISDRKQEMLELMRKEDRAFRQRKIATIAYWIMAAILFWLPVLVSMRWPSSVDSSSNFQVIAWVASFVLFGAGVVSTIVLLMRRRPVKDAQILAALYDIEASLQQLVNDQNKQ
jgi:Fe2+ transport system protein B